MSAVRMSSVATAAHVGAMAITEFPDGSPRIVQCAVRRADHPTKDARALEQLARLTVAFELDRPLEATR